MLLIVRNILAIVASMSLVACLSAILQYFSMLLRSSSVKCCLSKSKWNPSCNSDYVPGQNHTFLNKMLLVQYRLPKWPITRHNNTNCHFAYHPTTIHITKWRQLATHDFRWIVAFSAGQQWSSDHCSPRNTIGQFKCKAKVPNLCNKILIQQYIRATNNTCYNHNGFNQRFDVLVN